MRAFSAVSVNRVPQFLRDDYPAMTEFLDAYYEWLDVSQSQQTDFKSIRDIDTTLDAYLKYFKNTLASGLPDTTAADMRTVIKNIRQMFKAKGTEKSIKFLFKALFNDDISVTYPRTQIFSASDAVWTRSRSIKVVASGNIDDLVGKVATFTNGRFYIQSAQTASDSSFVLYISNLVGNVELVSTFTVDTTVFTITQQVVGATINTPGSGLKSNDALYLSNGVVLTVAETTRGPITGFNIVSGGTGYTNSSAVSFIHNGQYGYSSGKGAVATVGVTGSTITSVTILNGGSLYDLPPGVLVASGTGAVLRPTGNFGGVKSVSVVNAGTALPIDPWTETVSGCSITVVYGNCCEHAGTFSEANGVPSSTSSYLEDEHYYQYFSYVIKSGINIDQYKDIVGLLVHPAGMKQFSSFRINTLSKASTATAYSRFAVDLIRSVANRVTIKGSILEALHQSFGSQKRAAQWEIDKVYKFKYFTTTVINRFKDKVIQDWTDIPANLYRYKSTNIQPDAVVTLLNLAAGVPGGIGTEELGDAHIG